MNPCRLIRIVTAPARAFINAAAQLFENSLHDFDPILPDTDCALFEAEHEVIEPRYMRYTMTAPGRFTLGDMYVLREILWHDR